jgi:hypothetical protein
MQMQMQMQHPPCEGCERLPAHLHHHAEEEEEAHEAEARDRDRNREARKLPPTCACRREIKQDPPPTICSASPHSGFTALASQSVPVSPRPAQQ